MFLWARYPCMGTACLVGTLHPQAYRLNRLHCWNPASKPVWEPETVWEQRAWLELCTTKRNMEIDFVAGTLDPRPDGTYTRNRMGTAFMVGILHPKA